MTPEERRVRWIVQHIGFAKLLLTLAVAALGSILSWLAQTTGEGALRQLGQVGVAALSVVAAGVASWTLLMLRKLRKGEPHEPERMDHRREHRVRVTDVPGHDDHRIAYDPREMMD